MFEDTFMKRIQLPSKTVQEFGPVHLYLPVHQLLGLYVVLDPYKTVPLLSVLQPFFVHLSRQPFPAVYADLNTEGEPRLNPRVHPSHHRMDLILIHDPTRSFPAHDMRAAVFMCGTHLRRSDGTHQSSTDLSFPGHLTGQLVLVHRGGTLENDR